MNKNNKFSLIFLVSTAIFFVGILTGTFIGRITNKNANAAYLQKQHTETHPSYNYPFRTNETGKININTASVEELTMLPGIGKETAERIVAYRTQFGIFYSLDDLTNVKGLGKGTVNKLKPYATVGE